MTVTMLTPSQEAAPVQKQQVIKVLVWDLDHTVWNGTLLEGDVLELRPGVREALAALDQRGILHSIASKNEAEPAMERLRELGLDHFFLYPQINWNSKAASIEKIAKSINIGLDAVAFIDDLPYERNEVSYSFPQVLTFGADEVSSLLERPELKPRFITDESAIRRKMYQADIARQKVEEEFVGPKEDFLASLGMKFTIAPATVEDLKRAEELTVRTNQLNTTGCTYNYDELNAFRQSDDHLLLVAGLEDKHGTYGKIGLALIEKQEAIWNIKLLLMSCRVMSRGVGSILIQYILKSALAAGVEPRAEFKVTDRNRQMRVAYKFSGFYEIEKQGDRILYGHRLDQLQDYPSYVELDLAPI